MQPTFRPYFPPPLLRSEFSVEIVHPAPSVGSCALQRSFDYEAPHTIQSTYTIPSTNSLHVSKALDRCASTTSTSSSIPKPSHSKTMKRPALTSPLTRSASRANFLPSVQFAVPIVKPPGEACRKTNIKGRKGYLLKDVCTDRKGLNWSENEFNNNQVRS